MCTYDEQLVIGLDEEQQAVVGRLVLAQLLRVRQTDDRCGLVVAARRHGRRPVVRGRGGHRAGRRRQRGRVRRRRAAQVEQRRRQAHGQVAGGHLVHVAPGRDARQEVQQREQRLAVFVRQQQHRAVDRLLLQVRRHVCDNTD